MADAKTQPTILFVCTGNTCRSPMAEHLFRARAGTGSEWRAESAGLAAAVGAPASEGAIAALQELGLDARNHRSQPVTRAAVDRAALILAMTSAHARELIRRFPEAAGRVRLLDSFGTDDGGRDIDDPIGHPVVVYRHVRGQIEQALADLILFLREHKGRNLLPGKEGQS